MRLKLNLGFLAIILLLWSICIYILLSSMSVQKTFNDLEGDILPGALLMTRMKYEAIEIKAWTISYIVRGNIVVKGGSIKEHVQGHCATLEKDVREHFELGVNVIADEQRVAEKIKHLSQKLISVSTEIIGLKDKGVEKDELLRKMGKELRPVFLSLKMILDEHTAEHFAVLSSAESKVQEKQILNIKFTIIFGSLATLLAIFIGLFVDRLFMRYVSQQKQTEKALREERNRAQGYLHIAGVMLATIDLGEKITLMNGKGCEILGYNKGELIGKNWFNTLVPQKIRGEVRDVFRKLMAGDIEPIEYFENMLITKHGEERLILFHNTALRDPAGQITGVMLSGEDITDPRKVEEALKQNEERYRTLSEQSADAIYITTQEGKFSYINQSFLDLFAYTKEELEDLKAKDIYFNTESRSSFQQEIEKKGSVREFEVKLLKKDGTEMDCLITANVRQADDGNILGYQGIIRDITHRKQAEEALRKAGALETLIQGYDNFIGDSLSNLLTPIYGHIELCEIRDSIDEIKGELGDIKGNITRLLVGINAYRKYSKTGESSAWKISSVDINSILSPLLSGRPLKAYGNEEFPIDPSVKLRFTYDPKKKGALSLDMLPSVSGSKLTIETALQESLINAVESYEPKKGGDVEVSAKMKDHNLILEIADKGRGMSEEDRDKSQLPFFKVLSVKQSARFGLGAYIALESAKRCGGDIHIKSTEGVGTIASISFKVSDDAS